MYDGECVTNQDVLVAKQKHLRYKQVHILEVLFVSPLFS